MIYQITTLSGKIETEEEKVQKLEINIKRIRVSIQDIRRHDKVLTALQDLWEPELTRLVDSIGEKFSAAFDRTY